jgi:hypothetical protein
MNLSDIIPIPPPITEVPDYVWARRYDIPVFPSERPAREACTEGRKISHPDVESALRAAKCACRAHPGRWFGRGSSRADGVEFLVREDGKIIERHVVGR